MHTPWIDGARLPSDPTQPVVPTLGPSAPYYVIGGSDWDMRTIHIEGNACMGCHRMAMETDLLYRDGLNGSHTSNGAGLEADQWMPPHAPGSLRADYQELLEGGENGPENTPGCEWRLPPGGGCADRTAGPDHPRMSGFNDGRSRFN